MQILNVIKKLKQILPEYNWVITPNLNLGILTSNYAFIEAKKQRVSPKELAESLAIEINSLFLNENLDYQVKAVGPYLNLYLGKSFLSQYLNSDWSEVRLEKNNLKLLLEFISPNIAKPLHAGHLLQANYGESLRRILSLKYETVITDCHLGDWGVNIGKLLWGFEKLEAHKFLEFEVNNQLIKASLADYETNPIETMSRVYIWSNQQKDVEPNYSEQIKQKTKLLESGDIKTRNLWQRFVDDSSNYTNNFLEKINIKPFDLVQGESFYEKETENLSNFLEQNNLWKKLEKGRYLEKDDLLISENNLDDKETMISPRLKNFGRCYLRESTNGYTTYALRDVAARIQWARDLKIDKMITLVGNEQIHHFNQFIGITSWLSNNQDFINHYGEPVAHRLGIDSIDSLHNGFITLAGGEKMSARTGNFLTAEYLLETVKAKITESFKTRGEGKEKIEGQEEASKKISIMANASLKWFNLNRDINQDAVCNLETILKFEGNTGIYQLYTVARLNSILLKNNFDSNSLDQVNDSAIINWGKLNSIEVNLAQKTLYLDYILDTINTNYKPHLLTTYLYELCNDINSWYAKHSVISEVDSERRNSMLGICYKLNQALKFSLDLLAIQTLDVL